METWHQHEAEQARLVVAKEVQYAIEQFNLGNRERFWMLHRAAGLVEPDESMPRQVALWSALAEVCDERAGDQGTGGEKPS